MPNLDTPQTSISNFAIELLVMVLLNLDTMDIIRAKQVCAVWYHCVAISTPLLRRTHKLPVVCDHGENPHFEALTEVSKAVTIPGGDREGDNLWDTVRAIEDAYMKRFDRSPRCTKSSRKPGAYVERYGENMADLRASFRGMRFQQRDENGRPQWPAGLREIQCHLCDRWHTKFHFQNLHPLLQFLDNGSTCFRGYGSRLMLNINLVEDWKMPLASYEHSCSLMVDLEGCSIGRCLRYNMLAQQRISFHVLSRQSSFHAVLGRLKMRLDLLYERWFLPSCCTSVFTFCNGNSGCATSMTMCTSSRRPRRCGKKFKKSTRLSTLSEGIGVSD